MIPASVATEQLKNKAWNSRSTEKVKAQLGSAAVGLSATEATKRLAADGPNELKMASAAARCRFSYDDYR